MKRQLIIGERIMYCDGQTPLNSAFVARIRGAIPPEQLRHALTKVQAKHPLLKAGVAPGKNGRPHFITNAQITEIPLRITTRKSDEDWQQESAMEWRTPFDMQNGPLCRLVWVRGADISELILVCHHCICDGASVASLLREVLILTDEPDTDLPPYESFGDIKELIPAPYLQNKQLIWKGRKSAVLLWGGLAFLLWRKKTPSKGQDYMVHWKLDKDITAAFVKRCKTEGASVHAALCVAFLRAFQQVKGTEAKNRVITPVDIRRYITNLQPDHLFAYAPTVNLSLNTAAPVTAKSFWVQAYQVKEDLQQKVAELNVFIQLMLGEYLHASVKKLSKLLRVTDGNHDVTLSNMGRLNIPENFRSFEVETIMSPTVAFPWRNPNTLVTTTYKGQMDFTFTSNEHFLPYEQAVAVKEAAMALLVKEAAMVAVL
ncbi:hypothetical protein F0L74_24195 [Chitinophaga agrisoli]|uniref:Condensation domain-containing protein n=1 Tax=Chitinophaga agrisoli TaxID=2607653 RepID=A0A5B2VM97_9BACT|nr:condensation domain-containing protein [Chitinophaga agrisoli]KAA2239309.1 hypothetical protein F0L74_24195 [Chitinophaga agrisoli]